MKNMLAALAKDAVVLIDAPPLLPVTDAAVLARAADGAILVIRTGKTTQDQLDQSLGNLEKVKGRVLGSVLNYVPSKGRDAYSYYGTYTAASAPPADTPSAHDRDEKDALGALEAAAGGRRARV
ncbi:tyrosine-protein kinase family protein [Arthrobacter oryzae]|uniref:tyrosine-protein kinase family protein n=1 Tax=Arthrobacter oryzae TaxID=409290 RepID=UPI0035944F37